MKGPRPMRIEPALSIDYIDRAAKMRSFKAGQVISPAELLKYWIGLGVLVTACLLAWWLQ